MHSAFAYASRATVPKMASLSFLPQPWPADWVLFHRLSISADLHFVRTLLSCVIRSLEGQSLVERKPVVVVAANPFLAMVILPATS